MKETDYSSSENKSLLFIVELEDILKEETTLEKTNSWDSIRVKKEQVGNNIIDNSWVLYNKIINSKINEEIEKRVPAINNIECNRYNENELVNVQLTIKRKTIFNLMQHYFDQFNDIDLINSGLDMILSDFTKKIIDKQQSTTMFLEFNRRIPNKPVLNKLEEIGEIINLDNGVLIRKSELRRIVNDLFNPDPRTLKNYMQCLIDFARQNGNPVNESFYEIRFNMRGFLETVRRYLNQNSRKYAN